MIVAQTESIRTVELQPPSAADEISWVVMAAAFIVLCVIYAIAFETHDGGPGEGAAARSLLPFQVLFRDLPSPEQRVFRQMQEGAVEAIRLRAERGAWPEVAALAAQGIPPFADDGIDPVRREWFFRRDGLVGNYVGRPTTDVDAPAFLLLVVEPDPVTGERPPPPSVIDEEHKLLSDRVLLHVTYWKKRAGDVGSGLVTDPAMSGWTQIRVRNPFEEMEAVWDRRS